MNSVSLDLEEVLADTIAQACRSTDSLSRDDFETWDIKPGYTWQVYAGVSDALWRHDPLSIPPVENDISETVDSLYQKSDRLDIVTARLHVHEQVERWLDEHDITYDNIVATREPKHTLCYDLHIDDNPEMHGECRLLLRDHPHNHHVDASNSKLTDRIHSLDEAVEFL
jgi:hypothetical protein